jgi:hypothetical protein
VDFMTPVVNHPCAGHIFAFDATINTLGSMVARRCGLEPPRAPEPRCKILPGAICTPPPLNHTSIGSIQEEGCLGELLHLHETKAHGAG